MLAVTDGLNRLFSNDLAPLRLARDLGLAAVDRLPPVKRLLMRHAMGAAGPRPRLLRGLAAVDFSPCPSLAPTVMVGEGRPSTSLHAQLRM